jgi:serine/threonine protein kinase
MAPEQIGRINRSVDSRSDLYSLGVIFYGLCLWARGYPAQRGFIVMAGSELRSTVKPRAPPILSSRRADLATADALATIPGASDRLRLRVAVWFPSRAIAAKVLCGSKDASMWLDHPGSRQCGDSANDRFAPPIPALRDVST